MADGGVGGGVVALGCLSLAGTGAACDNSWLMRSPKLGELCPVGGSGSITRLARVCLGAAGVKLSVGVTDGGTGGTEPVIGAVGVGSTVGATAIGGGRFGPGWGAVTGNGVVGATGEGDDAGAAEAEVFAGGDGADGVRLGEACRGGTVAAGADGLLLTGASARTSWTARTTSSIPTCDLTR